MTDGEKMVWAAVYATWLHHYETKTRPKHINAEQWEREKVHVAMERAGMAVRHLRLYEESFGQGQGKDSAVYRMLVEVIEDTDHNC